MEVKFSYNPHFDELIRKLTIKYGEQIFELEGIGSQLDLDAFNKQFFATDRIGDVSVDTNANVRSKHAATYFTEVGKPFLRLNSIYVIWKEMAKRFGYEVADAFVEAQINGAIYVHDLHHAAYVPYCVMRDELMLVKTEDGKALAVSIEELYNMVEGEERPIDNKAVEKDVSNRDIYVRDKDGWTKLVRVVKKHHDNKFVFIKTANGLGKVVTEDHSVITDKGVVKAIDVKPGMKIYTELSPITFGSEDEISLIDVLKEFYDNDYVETHILVDGVPITDVDYIPDDALLSLKKSPFFLRNKIKLDKEFGWVIGLIISEGFLSQSDVSIVNKDDAILERVKRFAKWYSINFSIYSHGNTRRLVFRNKLFRLLVGYFITGKDARNKALRSDFVRFNKEFLYGIVGGVVDGDGTQMANFIKGRSNRINIRMTSRKLLNQLRLIIQHAGYIVRDGRPQHPGENSQIQGKHMIYKIAFTPLQGGELFGSQKIMEHASRLTSLNKIKQYTNSQYTFEYGWQPVIVVQPFSDSTEDYVYDITTESHSFMINGMMTHNCFAYTLRPIVENGLQFIDSIKSDPPKHLSTFIQHVIQFVMFASNQSSGAVGLPDFFVWMWYFVKKDLEQGIIPREHLKWYIEQHFQILTYSFNQPIRTNQAPYTNFTYLDRNYIKAIFEEETYPDGSSIVDETENILKLQQHYWEWVAKERERQMFTFPVLTATLLYKDGKFIDEESAKFINKVNLKWQDTNWYISNSVDAVASCCRLTSSTKDLKLSFSLVAEDEQVEKLAGMANSIGGSDLNIGSFKVVTINLPRIALEAKGDEKKFFEILQERLDLVLNILATVRGIIKERISQGFLPLYTHELMQLDRQYGTVGFTGVWEAATFMGYTYEDIDGVKYTPEGELFVDKILNEIRMALDRGFEKYKFTFNTEQVPAEKAAVVLAQKDALLFGTERQGFSLYSNQWVPLMANTEMINRVLYSGRWDKQVSGGAILHINLGTPFRNEQESWQMVNLIAKKGVIYFAFNQKISVCENGHAFYGERCPICGKPKKDEISRVVGYFVPVSAYNPERRTVEYPQRQFYTKLN